MNPIPSRRSRLARAPGAVSIGSVAAGFLAFSSACMADLPEPPDLVPRVPWNLADGPTLHRVLFEDGRFIAVGTDGTIVVSMDGIAWELRDSGVMNHLRGAVRGPDGWWVVGDGGIILFSPDTIRWVQVDSPVGQTLNDIAYGSCQFVAVGASGTILTSFDGWRWNLRTSGVSTEIRRVVDAGPFFIAGGVSRTLLRSRDGIRWIPHLTGGGPVGIRDLVVAGERLLAIGCCGGGIFQSFRDGPWIPRPIPGASSLSAAAIGGGTKVVVGVNGTILSTPADAAEDFWHVSESGTSRALHDVAYGNGLWVVVGSSGTLLISSDARNWQSATRWFPGK